MDNNNQPQPEQPANPPQPQYNNPAPQPVAPPQPAMQPQQPGMPVQPMQPQQPGYPVQPMQGGVEQRSFLVAVLLSIFLGGFGADRFYLGRTGLGIAKIFPGCLTFGIWWLVDLILLLTKRMKPGEGIIIVD